MKIKLINHLLVFSTITSSIALPAIQINYSNFLEFGNESLKADQWGENYFKTWQKSGLTDSEKSAFNFYTTNEGKLINIYLRITEGELLTNKQDQRYREIEEIIEGYASKIKVDFLTKTIKKMINSSKRITIPENIIVYRWITESTFALPKDSLKIFNKINRNIFKELERNLGKSKRHNGFLSTSLINKTINFNFDTYPIRLNIKVPKGANGLYIAPLSEYNDEKEILIRNKQFLIYDTFQIVQKSNVEFVSIDATLKSY